ncbi:MAG: choice-of-anchor J domain-containing protein [Bacteroidales bacterium]|nr:choice-of-anchor J domain-containing protein [Bacteroidales bacterium]
MIFVKNRMIGSVPITLASIILLPVMIFLSVRIYSQSIPASPAVIQGIITNGATGSPIPGAKVGVNGKFAWSTSGGIYTLTINPTGTFPVSCTKAGYDNYSSPPVLFQPGVTAQMNIQLWENLNAPGNVSVFLDTILQRVPVSWNAPSGNYELLYDDGIQDNFTVWASQGNMNSLKFSPAGFPVKVTGGSVHIGTAGNYPAGSNPLVAFQIRIYDATGAGGTPGNTLAGPFDIIPTALGWVEFTLPVPLTINSGAFFIAMVQGGNAPNAAGIAIDETAPQFRSYSRFASGGGPWFPAGGNFMIRARCTGPGGPAYLSDDPLMVSGYNIYRLRQGEEQNPAIWTMIGTTTATSFSDNNWPLLPCGPYRWGVKAQYPGNRWSPTSFSNILGKCWTAPVNIHLTLSCDSSSLIGTSVKMVNLAYPDTMYLAAAGTGGIVSFPKVWKGTYQLTIIKFGYETHVQSLPVTGTVSLNIFLLQVQNPPANLSVNDSSLMARWDVPHFENSIFSEQWNSSSLSANAWTLDGGSNWTISNVTGNPSPSVVFISTPQQTNYSQSLISKTISGQQSTLLKLKYDIFLNNAGTTTVNQMAVEIWDGLAWHQLKSYSSAEGNIPWTSDDLDISGYTNMNFKIRFRAFGGNSLDINNWNIDNIKVIASEPAQEQANCILGYYFYLGNVISGYTTKNAYPIPGNQVQYGQTYNACVRALYGSGYSDFTCTTFTCRFLYPALNLQGYPVENAAFIEWEKPLAATDTSFVIPPGLVGYSIFRDGALIKTINDPDSLSIFDFGLEPGYYRYGVSAKYDLTAYGFPGQIGESLPAGPLHITINWGRQLPFFESWNSGTFSFNDWRFTPSQGNWVIDQYEGLPLPAANFRWQPPVINYNYSIESPAFNGLPFNCAAIWLDFDLKLNDRNYTGTEKMIVEAYYNNMWHKKAEIKNTGSLPWTNYHIDISPARGKGFRVRFRAAGQNSSEILNWYIDNINIYPVCYPATHLAVVSLGNAARLSWSPPACYGGSLLNEGFEGTLFPPPQWTRQITNPSASWSRIPSNSPLGVHNGSFAAGLNWDYNHQDEWLIAHNIYVNGDMTFWSYAFQGSLHLDHYYVKVSPDQGATWDILLDMSALPPYPGTSGVNAWITPYHVDLSMYEGETVDIAWHAVDGDGNGLWYPWAIDDCSIGADDNYQQIIGYDIYRKGFGTTVFNKINTDIVADTAYIDNGLLLGQYKYFVQAQFNECETASNSDTVMVDIITGVGFLNSSGLTVYPNPASDQITISSSSELGEIRMYNASGKLTGTWDNGGKHKLTINTQGLPQGLFLLRIHVGRDIKIFKISIVK